jgi:hypothetical protein
MDNLERAIKNGQSREGNQESRDTGNIEHKTNIAKKKTIQKTKKMSNAGT